MQASNTQLNVPMHPVSCCATKKTTYLISSESLLSIKACPTLQVCTMMITVSFRLVSGSLGCNTQNQHVEVLRRQLSETEEDKIFCHPSLHSITFSRDEAQLQAKEPVRLQKFSFLSPVLKQQKKVSSISPVLLNVEKTILLGHLPVLCSM